MTDTIPGDSSTTASLSAGSSIIGNIDFSGDDDWFRIALVGGNEYVFDLTSGLNGGGGTLADPFLRRLRDGRVWKMAFGRHRGSFSHGSGLR